MMRKVEFGVDVDPLDRIHLDGDVQRHAAPLAMLGQVMAEPPGAGKGRRPARRRGILHSPARCAMGARMILYPAIDLKDGQCVRLLRGEMDEATVFGDGSRRRRRGRSRRPAAAGCIWSTSTAPSPGGRSTRGAVEAILAAVGDPGAARRRHPRPRHARGLAGEGRRAGHPRHRGAARSRPRPRGGAGPSRPGRGRRSTPADGHVAVEGWAETTDTLATELARRFEDAGVAAIVYTDIERDGALAGPERGGHGGAGASRRDPGDRLGRHRLDGRPARAEGERRAARRGDLGPRALRGPARPRGSRARISRLMLKVRVIPCLDVKEGRVVKGVNFVGLRRRRATRSRRRGPTTRRGRTSSASSTSRRARRTAARCSISPRAPPSSASCR